MKLVQSIKQVIYTCNILHICRQKNGGVSGRERCFFFFKLECKYLYFFLEC